MSRQGYFFDISVLDKWSEMRAWLLGFSFADMMRVREDIRGNRVYKCYMSGWHLGKEKQNIYILNEIRKYFRTNAKIEYKKDDSYSLSIFNQKISEYFDRYIAFDKMKHEYPKDLPGRYDSHFMRGLLDGDGSIWVDKHDNFGAYFIGGPDILATIKEKLDIQSITSKKIRKMDVRCYRLEFTEKNSVLLCNYLYQDATIYLPSKYNIYSLSQGPLDSNVKVNSQLKSVNNQNAEGKTEKSLSDFIGSRRDLAEMLKHVLGSAYVVQKKSGLELYKYPYPMYKTKGWKLDTVKQAGSILSNKHINFAYPKRGKGSYKSYTIYIPFAQHTCLHAAQPEMVEGIVQFERIEKHPLTKSRWV